MPIFDFKCASCGHVEEVLQSGSAPATKSCPSCGKETFEKQVSASSFHLKGSGWYKTDFKNDKSGGSCGGGNCGCH